MKKVLLLCSSTDGQTRKICDRLRRMMQDAGDEVTLAMIEDARELSPAGFQMAVIGARIRYGRTDARVIEYANRHAAVLNAMPSAYFSVNVVARKPEKSRPETNPYVQAFVRRTFAGCKLDFAAPVLIECFARKGSAKCSAVFRKQRLYRRTHRA